MATKLLKSLLVMIAAFSASQCTEPDRTTSKKIPHIVPINIVHICTSYLQLNGFTRINAQSILALLDKAISREAG